MAGSVTDDLLATMVETDLPASPFCLYVILGKANLRLHFQHMGYIGNEGTVFCVQMKKKTADNISKVMMHFNWKL